MREVIMGYQGEMSLKGLNRNQFESAMMKILRYRLKTVGKFRVLVLSPRNPLFTLENRERHTPGIVFSQGIQPDRTAPALTAERGIMTGLDFIPGLLHQLQQPIPICRLLR
mgnify:CR=1 FL=1